MVGGCWLLQEIGVPAIFLGSTTIEALTGEGIPNFIASGTSLNVETISRLDTTANATVNSKPPLEQALYYKKQATVVIQLSGEMANNLHHISHGLGLKLLAKEEFDVDCNVVIRHFEGPNNRAPKPKWKSARDNIQMCFPNLAQWKFSEGNNKDFLNKQNMQRAWLQGRVDHLFGLINSEDISMVRRGLDYFANDILIDPNRPQIDDDSPVRLPYLYSNTLNAFPMIDRYYDEIRNLMLFNDSACCSQLPGPDDSVFHFRNYESEMPERRAYDMGFAELSPAKVADEVFERLQPGNHVHITTRIYNQKARNYAEALRRRGINASVVTDQSSVQDFCYLKRAQKEVVGSARSTFVMWAALLGNASIVRLYHVDNHGLRRRYPDFWEQFTFNFTHPRLRDRVKFELYYAEERRR